MQRHATDVISLVVGTILAGFGAVWLLTLTGVLADDQAWLAGPVVLITAGAVGLAAALRPRWAATPATSSDAPEASPNDSRP